MFKEILKQLLSRIKSARALEKDGFADQKQAFEYLTEREGLLGEVANALSEIGETVDQEVTALKSQLGEAMKKLAEKPVEIREKTRDDFLTDIGRFVRAATRKNEAEIDALKGSPNTKEKTGDWDSSRSFQFNAEKGKFERTSHASEKALIGTPFGTSGDGTYVINPIYERELIRYALEKSDTMDIVRNIPMAANQISWPTLSRNSGALTWLSATGDAISEVGKPDFGTRVLLTAATLAGYIPWFDEFEDDVQINLSFGQLFSEMFAELYAQEFDNQVLNAATAPFKGIFRMTGVGECLKHYIAGTNPTGIQIDDFRDAPLKIPRADRGNGMWLVSESLVSYLISLRNTVGDFLIQPPMDPTHPGKLCGFPYRECRDIVNISECGSNTPFAWFGDPRRILWHGDRKAIEIRSFMETTESMIYGEQFIRFRKRDAFKVVQPDLSVLLMTR